VRHEARTKDTLMTHRTHPTAPRLEAIAAGDDPGPIAEHLAACEPCAAYVAKLRVEAAAFRAKADPMAFAESVRARSGVNLERSRRARIAWVIGPSLAAAIALVVWRPSTPTTESGSSQVDRFKGGVSIVAVRDRRGVQERLTGPFEVEPSDRIRLEVAMDRDGPSTAGLLSQDGSWAPLLAPTVLAAGTHYSELAARFDDTPTDAVLLVGPPDRVDRARATRNFDGLVMWHVTSARSR
jgi:hypothetical protein